MQDTVSQASEQPQPPQERGEDTRGSGQGAASALARLQSQRERRARQKPAEETLAGRRGAGTPSAS